MLTGLVDIYIDSADGTVAEHVQSPLAGVFFSRSSHPLYHVVIDHNAVAGIMFGVDREQRQGINVYGCIATIECIKVIFGFRALVSEPHIGHILGSFSQLNTIVLVSQSLDSSDFIPLFSTFRWNLPALMETHPLSSTYIPLNSSTVGFAGLKTGTNTSFV